MSAHVDLAILGAGPAGLAAATRARAVGLSVAVLDEQAAPGGQIWRAVEVLARAGRAAGLGPDYSAGQEAVAACRASGATLMPGHQVWAIEKGWVVHTLSDGTPGRITADRLLLATGAQERPVPVPGWTLPGVLTVGAAQILLKSAGQIPDGPVWIVGSGPLPMLYASQLLAAGGTIAGVLDTAPRPDLLRVAAHLPGALGAYDTLLKGLRLLWARRSAPYPVISSIASVAIEGGTAVEAIRYRTSDGEERLVETQTVLLHDGIIPNVHVARSLGCALVWHEGQQCWMPVVTERFQSTVQGCFIAGDAAGIGGQKVASLQGELAAIAIARDLGRLAPARANGLEAPLRRRLAREQAIRPLLEALYCPRAWHRGLGDADIVCRCEELTAGEIRHAFTDGAIGPNQVKSFTRAGMGPCQGRQCGMTITAMLADHYRRAIPEVGLFNFRPPLKPVTIGQLARGRQDRES